MEKILLITGENEYLINKKVHEYSNAFGVADSDFLQFNLSEVSFGEVYEELITVSLFAPKKIIIINNITELVKFSHQEIRDFLKYLKNPNENVFLILKLIAKVIPNDDITVELLKYAYLEEVNSFSEADYFDYIIEMLKNADYKIDHDAALEILSRVANELFLLEQELNKLMLYKYDDKHIKLVDVQALVSRNEEDRIFELTNSLLAKNKEKTIAIYEDLMARNEDPLRVINNIATKLKEIIITKELLKKNVTQDEIANHFRISSGRAYHLRKNAIEADSVSVFTYMNALTKLDYEIKSGQATKKLGLELFLLSIK